MTTIVKQIKHCTLCPELAEQRTKVVIGEGPVPCDIVLLCEAPGVVEDRTGIPFSGRTGNILETALTQTGLQRNKCIHILNVLKCHPPKNRAPKQSELQNCRPYLIRQLKALSPMVIVALGRCAIAFVLGTNPEQTPVLKNVGRVVRYDEKTVAILSIPPSLISRSQNPDIKEALIKHLILAKDIRDRKVTTNDMYQMLNAPG